MLCTAGSGTYCRIVSDLWDMMFSCIVRVNWGNSPGCFSGCPNTFPVRKWLKQEGETNQLDGYQLDFSSLVVSFVESSKAHRKGWVFHTPAPHSSLRAAARHAKCLLLIPETTSVPLSFCLVGWVALLSPTEVGILKRVCWGSPGIGPASVHLSGIARRVQGWDWPMRLISLRANEM